jgi:hypothetical protein
MPLINVIHTAGITSTSLARTIEEWEWVNGGSPPSLIVLHTDTHTQLINEVVRNNNQPIKDFKFMGVPVIRSQDVANRNELLIV